MGRHYYRRVDVNIVASGVQKFGIGGDWLYYDVGHSCALSFDDGGIEMNVRRGFMLKHNFEAFTIRNTSSVYPLVGDFFAGIGEPPEFSDIPDQVQYLMQFEDVVCGPGALTQIYSKQPLCVGLWVSTPAGAQSVRVGTGTSVSATNGTWLNPGNMPLRIPGAHETYIYNPGAVAVNVAIAAEFV